MLEAIAIALAAVANLSLDVLAVFGPAAHHLLDDPALFASELFTPIAPEDTVSLTRVTRIRRSIVIGCVNQDQRGGCSNPSRSKRF
jgi:hypothetical protein